MEKSGKIRATIEDRQKKGYGIVAEILAILNEIPLGQYKMEIGLQLRQAMLVNGMLFNSEAWHSITEDELRMLEAVDEHLLRSLVKGHSKTSIEFLYLESGALPIRFMISTRRLLYLQTILKRPQEELTRRVYIAQKSNPVKGDFCKLVESDLELIGGNISEQHIQLVSKNTLKAEVKAKMQAAALRYLKQKQHQHSKIRNIVYSKLQTQAYMVSPLFTNDEVNTLHALRSRSVNVKANFKNKYGNNLLCPLCGLDEDSQPHMLVCTELNKLYESEELLSKKCSYDDLFGDQKEQKVITHLYLKLLNIRNQLLDKNLCKVADPSTSQQVLVNSDNLPYRIVHYSFGK